ncbi:hypothetical protein C8Q76DRAFT_692454 [Earliella scabrosa]|nr:hypothetical protein C8Q76DRAFT_692454 [Earliella scabrosa]
MPGGSDRPKTFVDADAIRDATDSSHPALNQASARYLRYEPATDGPLVILPRAEMRNTWWETDVQLSPTSPLVIPPGKRKASRSPSEERDIQRPATQGPETIFQPDEAETVPQTLSFCRKIKVKCSFMQVPSKALRCYLVWRLWRASQHIDEHPSPIFVPPEYASDSALPPDWWLAQTPVVRDRKRARTSEPPSKPVSPPSRGRARSRIAPAPRSEIHGEDSPSLDAATVSHQGPDPPLLAPHAAPAVTSAASCNPTPMPKATWTRPPSRVTPPSSGRTLRSRSAATRPRAAEQNTNNDPGPDTSGALSAIDVRPKSTSGVMRVPRLNGSWRDLPTLTRAPTQDPDVAESNSPPTQSFLPESWRPTASVSEAERLTIPSSASARPQTPPASTFQPGRTTIHLVEEAQRRIAYIRDLQSSLARAAAEAEALAENSRLRCLAAQTDVRTPDAVPEALELLATQQAQLDADARRGAEVLGRVSRTLASICSVFDLLPPIPMNDSALLEMLELVARLRELYGTIQTAFHTYQESLRPVQEELQRVREEQQVIIDRLDQVPNDVSTAVHPLLRHVYDHINRTCQPAQPTVIADGEDSTLAVSVSTSRHAPVGLWREVNVLRARIEALEGMQVSQADVGATGSTATDVIDASFATPPGEVDLQRTLIELGKRVTRLEGSQDSSLVVREYLEGLGLNSDTLRRLASTTLAQPNTGTTATCLPTSILLLRHNFPRNTMADPVYDNTMADRRAETAAFIVSVYNVYMREIAAGNPPGTTSAQLPNAPAHVSSVLHAECLDVARVLAQAASNVHTLTWDAAHYAASLQRATVGTVEYENALLQQFPPLGPVDVVIDDTKPLPVIPDPCVFCDRVGRRISWSLPGVMSERHQNIALGAVRALEARLTYDRMEQDEPTSRKWRTSDFYFTPSGSLKPGQVFLGPAWFEQGHLPPRYAPIVLSATKTPEASAWMSEMQETCQILDGILAVTHPVLYDAGRRLLQRLYQDNARSRAIVEQWPSVYHAVHIIVNRETIYHRDVNGLPGCVHGAEWSYIGSELFDSSDDTTLQ